VKRLRADDSGRTSVKVGHRQAFIPQNPTGNPVGFCLYISENLYFSAVVKMERSSEQAALQDKMQVRQKPVA